MNEMLKDRSWIVVGGGPSSDYQAWRRCLTPEMRIAATNRGFETVVTHLTPYPRIIWLSDPVAVRRWAHLVSRFSYLISCKQAASVLACADLHADELVPIDVTLRHYVPDRWSAPRYSGLMLVQWLLDRLRPVRLILAGFEGYEPAEDVHGTANTMGPWLQSAIDARPDVQFTVLGKPTYQLRGLTPLTAQEACHV